MKTPIFFATLLLIVATSLTSCNDNPESKTGLEGFQLAPPTTMSTVEKDNPNKWIQGGFLNIQSSNMNSFNYWTLQIGASSGYISQAETGNFNHWTGVITVKGECSPKDDYTNNIRLDTKVENDYNEWIYSSTGNEYVYLTIKTDRPDDFNDITVYQNNTFLFAIKTKTPGDINTWTFTDSNNWWSNQSMTSLYFLPVLFTIVQVL